jgi:TIR domain-containing protein
VSDPKAPAAAGRARSRQLQARALRVAAGLILLDVLFGVFAPPRLLARRSDHFESIQLEPEREELVIEAEPEPGEPLLGRDGPADFNLDVAAPSARIDQGSILAFRQLTQQEPPAVFGEIRYFSPPGSAGAPVSCPMNFRADAVDSARSVELHLRENKREGDRLRSIRLTAPRADLRVELEPVAPPDDPTPSGIGCERLLSVGGKEWSNFRSVKILLVAKHGSALTLTFWRLKGWDAPPPELLDLSELPVRSLRVSRRLELVSQTGKADLRVKNLIPASDKLQLAVTGSVLVTGSDVTLGQRPPLALAGMVVLGLLHIGPAVWLLRAFRRPRPAEAPGLAYLERRLSTSSLQLGREPMKDIFISFNSADRTWADWIAWILDEAKYQIVYQPWDFRPGANFVLEMQKAASEARKTVVVLSENYLKADYTQPEWAAAFAQDPRGDQRKLIPLRVAKCNPPGMLKSLIYADLVGLSMDEAKVAVLNAVSDDDRIRPAQPPPFPGSASSIKPGPVSYPGTPTPVPTTGASGTGVGRRALAIWEEKLEFLLEQEAFASDPAQRFTLSKQIEEARRKIQDLAR